MTPAQAHSVIRTSPPEREGRENRARVAMWSIALVNMCIHSASEEVNIIVNEEEEGGKNKKQPTKGATEVSQSVFFLTDK